jgi:hypothetical protein
VVKPVRRRRAPAVAAPAKSTAPGRPAKSATQGSKAAARKRLPRARRSAADFASEIARFRDETS